MIEWFVYQSVIVMTSSWEDTNRQWEGEPLKASLEEKESLFLWLTTKSIEYENSLLWKLIIRITNVRNICEKKNIRHLFVEGIQMQIIVGFTLLSVFDIFLFRLVCISHWLSILLYDNWTETMRKNNVMQWEYNPIRKTNNFRLKIQFNVFLCCLLSQVISEWKKSENLFVVFIHTFLGVNSGQWVKSVPIKFCQIIFFLQKLFSVLNIKNVLFWLENTFLYCFDWFGFSIILI